MYERRKQKVIKTMSVIRNKKRWLVVVSFVVSAMLLGVFIAYALQREDQKPSTTTKSPGLTNRFGTAPSYGDVYYVSPSGLDTNTGTTKDKPFLSIDKAFSHAEAGDTIQLADGNYFQTVASVKDGSKDKPISVKGTRAAVVRGTENAGRIFEIRHSYITRSGFTIDGQHGDGATPESYRDKLLYVIGREANKGVEGLKVTGMLLQNAGGECVRLRYFAINNEISNSVIKNCGIYDFRFDDGGKNGEGIYIGTAPEQRADGKNPTANIDVSRNNYIHHNTIETHGNECVDIKEGSRLNLIEHNTCEQQKDPDSAGFDARGNDNTFRYNISRNNVGAGVRLGGDSDKDGIGNHVYGNTLENNAGGAMKIMRLPQGNVCDNKLHNNDDDNNRSKGINPQTKCKNTID